MDLVGNYPIAFAKESNHCGPHRSHAGVVVARNGETSVADRSPAGVEVVRLYGASWSDQPSAITLFNPLAPLIRQIHVFLNGGDDNFDTDTLN